MALLTEDNAGIWLRSQLLHHFPAAPLPSAYMRVSLPPAAVTLLYYGMHQPLKVSSWLHCVSTQVA